MARSGQKSGVAAAPIRASHFLFETVCPRTSGWTMPRYAQVSRVPLLSASDCFQVVIGPPGAGKTTYCNGMNQFLGALGRKSSVVNLDAANNNLSYPCAINIFSLISLEDIMEHEQLGPNGGIMYALETLEANFEWLEEELAKLGGSKALK
jgi:hypothetical protein